MKTISEEDTHNGIYLIVLFNSLLNYKVENRKVKVQKAVATHFDSEPLSYHQSAGQPHPDVSKDKKCHLLKSFVLLHSVTMNAV